MTFAAVLALPDDTVVLLFLTQLLLGLPVTVGDELVEEAARLAGLVAVFLGVIDLLLNVVIRFIVGFVGGVVG